jgi:hypothetical protein
MMSENAFGSARVMLALLALVSLFGSGCWTVAYNRDTGVSMRLAASPTPSPPPSVVIRGFVKAELQAFDHSSYAVGTSIITTWKEAPGVRDFSQPLAAQLRSLGFPETSYQPDDNGDFQVTGYIERIEKKRTVGGVIWAGVGGTIQAFTLCLLPMYFTTPYESNIYIALHSRDGTLLKRKKIPVEYERSSTCIVGAMIHPADDVIAKSVATQVSDMIAAVTQSRAQR